MTASQAKLISFAKILEIAATHIFGDPSVGEFIPDKNNAMESPEIIRKNSQEAEIQLYLRRSTLAETNKALEAETDLDAKKLLEKSRDDFQGEILATLEKWKSEAQLLDLEARFAQECRAKSVLEKILGAFADEKLSLFLNSDLKLPSDIFSGAYEARFLPKELILECKIKGETRAGFVFGDENEIREWLACEDSAAGIYNTPDKRKRACAAQYEARILDPLTCNCTKEEHFIALKTRITGLRRKEFDSVHRALARKHTQISEGGRPRKTPSQI